jgi:hypothetical protein
MGRVDLVLDLIRTRNVVAASAVVGLFIASRVLLGNRRSAWLVFGFGVLAVALGYALRRFGG